VFLFVVEAMYFHKTSSCARVVIGESARQSVRARVNRCMWDSFRCYGFKWRLFARGERADSTPGHAGCEEQKPDATAAKTLSFANASSIVRALLPLPVRVHNIVNIF